MSRFAGVIAFSSRMPYRDGDGYSYGGEVILTVGGTSMLVGTGENAEALANEIAARWNATTKQDTPQ